MNRAKDYEKTMEMIEAHHDRQSNIDLATDFTIRKVSEVHARCKSFHQIIFDSRYSH